VPNYNLDADSVRMKRLSRFNDVKSGSGSVVVVVVVVVVA